MGDVVVIHEDSKKRALWKLGRVVELLRGKDNVVRGAKVKTDSRYSGGIIERPLQKLFPLEMGRGEVNDNDNDNDNDKTNDVEFIASTDPPDPSKMASEAISPRYPLRSRRL